VGSGHRGDREAAGEFADASQLLILVVGPHVQRSLASWTPTARQRRKPAAAAARVRCDGVTFTVTEGNEVAEVVRGAARAGQRELLRRGHRHAAPLRRRAGGRLGHAVPGVRA
jgi:hypothetical protein